MLRRVEPTVKALGGGVAPQIDFPRPLECCFFFFFIIIIGTFQGAMITSKHVKRNNRLQQCSRTVAHVLRNKAQIKYVESS